MKTLRHILTMTPAAILLACASSCSTLSGLPAFDKGEASKTSSSKASKKKHRDVLPQDRQQFIIDKAAKKYTPDELGRGIVKGDWAIEKVGDTAVSPEGEAPYLKFDIQTKKIYGNNGCNQFSGNYEYSPSEHSIRFTDMLSTMRACPHSDLDAEIDAAIRATRFYSWELIDSQFYLYLQDVSHHTLLTLMHQDFAFLNGTWLVKAIDDQAVAIPDLRFVIDVDENKIHGNTGCNMLNGKLITDMDAPNSISFQAIGITLRSCPDVEYENDLIVALEDASTARPISEDKVLLINNHGTVVLELERVGDR